MSHPIPDSPRTREAFGMPVPTDNLHVAAGPQEVRPIIRHVPKQWGSERWLVNNADYCGKFLRIKPGHSTSLHVHKIKRESFYVLEGMATIYLGSREQRQELLLTCQMMDIDPLTPHRLECCGTEDLVLIEFSTHHEDSDSYRVRPGANVDELQRGTS